MRRWGPVPGDAAVAVLVPYGGRDQHRGRLLAWTLVQLARHVPYEVIIGHHDSDEPWCKAVALDRALRETTAEVVILHDADVWAEGLEEAVNHVLETGVGWAIPHTTVRRLTPAATETVLSGGPLTGEVERAYRGVPAGGVTVLRRELYEEAPLDRRFIGWGQEDLAAGHTWRVLSGNPWRSVKPLWHLWHEPQQKLTAAIGSRPSKLLLDRYRAATDRGTLLELIHEGRDAA